MIPSVGDRVVRGADWVSGDEDGGEGNVGTVIGLASDRDEHAGSDSAKPSAERVAVKWDCGTIGKYRTGHDGKFDLCRLEIGFGRHHIRTWCNNCGTKPRGYRWHCLDCDEYDLCNACYNADFHELDHKFGLFVTSMGSFVRVPTRASSISLKFEARGLFGGAKVSKEGRMGLVVGFLRSEDMQERGGVVVKWEGDLEPTPHIRDEDGDIDLQCEEMSVYGSYYKDHLPKLGEKDLFLNVGDLACVLKTAEDMVTLQDGHGDWNPAMERTLREVGIIQLILYKGDIKLNFPNSGALLDLNYEAVTKLDAFGAGDVVMVISNKEEVQKLQMGHGGWKTDMAQFLDQEGTVLKKLDSGDVKVLINGEISTFHPACLRLVKKDDERPPTNWELAQDDIRRKAVEDEVMFAKAKAAISKLNYQPIDIIFYINNARDGNLQMVKNVLEKYPTMVNIKVSGKTAMHMACYKGHLNIVKYLLKKNFKVEMVDDEGFRPIHLAVLGKSENVTVHLLKHGVNPSPIDVKGQSPLHIAVAKGYSKCASALLKYGCNINIQDEDGDVALHNAITGQNKDCIKFLLESPKIDFTLRNSTGYNALHFAALMNEEIIVDAILKRMPNMANIKTDDGLTALHLAAFQNNANIARILIDKGKCDVDVLANRHSSALLLAVQALATDTAVVLISRGANVNIPDAFGDTSIHIFLQHLKDPEFHLEESPVLRKIRETMSDVDVPSPEGAFACYLAQSGGDLDAVNQDGESCWSLVTDNNLRQCLEKSVDPSRRTTSQRSRDESVLSKILPFLRRSPASQKTSSMPQIPTLHRTPKVSINPFDIIVDIPCAHGKELPTPPVEKGDLQTTLSSEAVPNLDSRQKPDKAIELACTTCQEPLTEVIGAPCQHVQPWLAEDDSNDTSTASAQVQTPKRVFAKLRRQNSEFRLALACTVCYQRKKAVVFECGHSTCQTCAEHLPECPVCRKPARKVLPLIM